MTNVGGGRDAVGKDYEVLKESNARLQRKIIELVKALEL